MADKEYDIIVVGSGAGGGMWCGCGGISAPQYCSQHQCPPGVRVDDVSPAAVS